MNGVATTTDTSPKVSSNPWLNCGPQAARAMVWKRMIPNSAHLMRAPDSRADTGVGAWLCASGNHMCTGARPALVP